MGQGHPPPLENLSFRLGKVICTAHAGLRMHRSLSQLCMCVTK